MDRLQQMRSFLASDPNDSFARYAVALELIARDDLDEARGELEEVIRRDGDYVAAYYQLGTLLDRAGASTEAAATLRAGIDAARRIGDQHTLAELEEALDQLDLS